MLENQLAAVAKFCRDNDGTFSLAYTLTGGPHWSAMLNFGREAPDSPMVAGSILGSGDTPEECLASLIEEGKIECRVVTPEPIPITDAFKACFERLLESHGDASPEEITDTVAREYGIPLESLNEAIVRQVPVVMAYVVLFGPPRAIGASNMGAFIAGVAWEQSRAAK